MGGGRIAELWTRPLLEILEPRLLLDGAVGIGGRIMSRASHMVGRLRKLYGIVWGRMRFLNERLMHPPVARQGTVPQCALEPLEPRLLLSVTFASQTFAAGDHPTSVVAADFDRDPNGHLDLVTANASAGTISLFRGNGNGTFQPATNYDASAASSMRNIAVADFNRDSWLDVVVAYDTGRVGVLLGSSSGFGAAQYYVVNSSVRTFVAVGDFNGDQKPDIVTANEGQDKISILLGNGSGGFGTAQQFAAGPSPESVVVSDFDQDGDQDIALAGNSGLANVLLGNGNGTFGTWQAYQAGGSLPWSIAAGDFDGDTVKDLVTANEYLGSVYVLAGHSDGTFSSGQPYPAGLKPVFVSTACLDDNGTLDLITVNQNGNDISVLLGNGNGTFGSAQHFAVGTGPRYAAIGDFDEDGRPDIAVSNYSTNNVTVLLNRADFNHAPTLTAIDALPGAVSVLPYTITYEALAAAANEADPDGDHPIQFRIETVDTGSLTKNGQPVRPGSLYPDATLLGPGESLVWHNLDYPAAVYGLIQAFKVTAWDGRLPSATPVQVTIQVSNAPTITIDDPMPWEGDNGLSPCDVTVFLTMGSPQDVYVDYVTQDGTATVADNDYIETHGTLTIPAEQTSGTIPVSIVGDTKFEMETNPVGEWETFYVVLSNPRGAQMGDDTGAVRIMNDDQLGDPPTMSIGDVPLAEGNSGTTTFNFPVYLSSPWPFNVEVHYGTADGTATVADSDYVPTDGWLTLAAGQTVGTIPVSVQGDTKVENDEHFYVGLAFAGQITIVDNTGVGTIRNDEMLPDDVYEDNDSKATTDGRSEGGGNSPNLGLLSAQRIIGSLVLGDSADWYKFRMNGTGQPGDYVRLDLTHTEGDLDMEVYRSDGTALVGRSNGVGNREEVSLSGQPAGTYYVKVYGWLGALNPDYTLTIDPGAPPAISPDVYENNDTRPITDGRPEGDSNSPNLGLLTSQRVIGGLTMEDSGDWYKFRMNGTGQPVDFVRIEFVHSQGDLDMEVYRSDGTSLVGRSVSTTNREEISLNGQPTGTYYVRVYGWEGASNPNYTLTIDPATFAPSDDAYEDNDSKAITDGHTAGGTNSPNLGELTSERVITDLALADGTDWYRFEMATPGSNAHYVGIDFDPNQGDLDLRVYRADGTTLVDGSYGKGDHEQVSLAGVPAGTYYVEVYGWSGATNPSYSLTIDPPQPGLARNIIETSWQLAATGLYRSFLGIPLGIQTLGFSVVNGMMETAIDALMGLLPPSINASAEITYGISAHAEVSAGPPGFSLVLGRLATGYNLTRDCHHNNWTISRMISISSPVGSLSAEYYARFNTLTPEPSNITFGFRAIGSGGWAPVVSMAHVLSANVLGQTEDLTLVAETTLNTSDFLLNYVQQPTLAEGLADVFVPYWGDTWWENAISWVGGVANGFSPIVNINTLVDILRTDTPLGILAHGDEVIVKVLHGSHFSSSFAMGPGVSAGVGGVGVSVGVGLSWGYTPPAVWWQHTYPDWLPQEPGSGDSLAWTVGSGTSSKEALPSADDASFLVVPPSIGPSQTAGAHVPSVNTFTATPSPATLGEILFLAATASDTDPGDEVTEVAFYLDDGDGVPESDELIGRDWDSGAGWSYDWDTKLETAGSKTLLVVAFDSDKNPSAPYHLTVEILPVTGNRRPAVTTLTGEPVPAVRGDTVTMTATAEDPDTGDSITQVAFFDDANGDGVPDPAELLGIDANPGGGWTFQVNTSLRPSGTIRVLAVAEDQQKETSVPRSLGIALLEPPTVGLLVDGPDPIEVGRSMSLAAADVLDPDGDIARVEFYWDTNGDFELDPGVDYLLSTDTDGNDGWACSVSTSGWPVGVRRYLARAQDDDGLWSNTAIAGALLEDDLTPPTVSAVYLGSTAWTTGFTDGLASAGIGNANGYAIPVGSGVQLKALPWTNINQIKVVFSEDVLVDMGDLRLDGVNVGSYGVNSFSYDAGTFTATWTLSAAIGADKLLIELNADGPDPIRDAAGNALDGEWDNPTGTGDPSSDTYPSGDGTAGGNFQFRFNVLPGDVNQNGYVQASDGLLVRGALGASTTGGNYSIFKDVNANGYVQASDGLLVRGRLGGSLPPGEPSAGGFDELTTSGFDELTTIGFDALTAGGFDELTAGGFDALTAGGFDELTAGGFDGLTAGGFGAMSVEPLALLMPNAGPSESAPAKPLSGSSESAYCGGSQEYAEFLSSAGKLAGLGPVRSDGETRVAGADSRSGAALRPLKLDIPEAAAADPSPALGRPIPADILVLWWGTIGTRGAAGESLINRDLGVLDTLTVSPLLVLPVGA